MAASKLALLCATVALLTQSVWTQETTTICPRNTYSPDAAFEFCYLYVQSNEDYFSANRSCVRDGAVLLEIYSSTENDFIRERFFDIDQQDFWIGLNDINREGAFRWINNSEIVPSYVQWSSTSPDDNRENYNCVRFTAGGWQIQQDFCGTSFLPFICKMRACQSVDSEFCIGQEPTLPPSAGLSTAAVVAIIVVLLVVTIAIVVVITLVCLWKFKNDIFYRYVCCCCGGGGANPSGMHSLQQENQRLRHELSQHKISLGGSGRYSQGQLGRELSGVPDGRGGVLPALKPSAGTAVSPAIPENRPISFSTTQAPPPLNVQRYSRVTPVNKPSIGSTTPAIFTGQRASRQVSQTSVPSFPFPKSSVTQQQQQQQQPVPGAAEMKQPVGAAAGDGDATSTGSSSSSSLSDKQTE